MLVRISDTQRLNISTIEYIDEEDKLIILQSGKTYGVQQEYWEEVVKAIDIFEELEMIHWMKAEIKENG